MPETAQIVKKYLRERDLTLQAFAGQLTESLNIGLSHPTIINWKNGKTAPETDLLLQCLTAYSDWRQAFAFECLRAKLPGVFGDGEILRAYAELAKHER